MKKLINKVKLSALPVLAGGASLLITGAFAQSAQDKFLGRWVLDPKTSSYPAKSCPRQMTIEMTSESGGIHYHSVTVPQQGSAFEVDYTAKYDGVPALVTGSRGVLFPVSLRRENNDAVIATYSNGLATAATSRRTLSADGRVMTIKTVSQDAGGLFITNIGVYHRTETLPKAEFDLKKADSELPSYR